MTKEGTTGAKKAAAALWEDGNRFGPFPSKADQISKHSAIIDRETGLPELVEALKDIASVDRIMIDGLGYEGVITKITERAQAVLAKYEGKD